MSMNNTNGFVVEVFQSSSIMDSYYDDFYAVVWNPETKMPETINTGSNRGSGKLLKIDAPLEVMEAYKNYLLKKKIDAELEEKRNKEAARKNLVQHIQMVCEQYKIANQAKAIGLFTSPKGEILLPLFSNRISNSFKLSLRDQVEAWLANSNSKYNFPLSDKQVNALRHLNATRT